MNKKQFTVLIIVLVLGIGGGIYALIPSKTPEQILAETQRTVELQKLKQLELEAEQKRSIEAQKARADIQASKPVEVQVAETKVSTGEAVVGATAIVTGGYIFVKLLDAMSN